MFATLLDCPVRFHGEYGSTAVETFIEYVNAYKAIKNLTDKQCTAELPFLLEGHARAWFQLRSTNFEAKGFQSIIKAIHTQFSTVVPPFVLYVMLSEPYIDGKFSVIQFMKHKLEIFAQLPPPHHVDSVKIDMIYGLLPKQFQSMMPRNELATVDDFINKIRTCQAQISQQSSDEENQAPQTNSKPAPAPAQTDSIIKKRGGDEADIVSATGNSQQSAGSTRTANTSDTKHVDAGIVDQRLTAISAQQKPALAPEAGVNVAGLNGRTTPDQEVISTIPEKSVVSGVGNEIQQRHSDQAGRHDAAVEIGISSGYVKEMLELKESIKIEIDSDILDQISSIFGDCEFTGESGDTSCQQRCTPRTKQMPTAPAATPTLLETTMRQANEATSMESTGPIGLNDLNKIVKRNLYTREVEPFSLQVRTKKSTSRGSTPAETVTQDTKNPMASRLRPAKRRKGGNRMFMTHERNKKSAEVLMDGQLERRKRQKRI